MFDEFGDLELKLKSERHLNTKKIGYLFGSCKHSWRKPKLKCWKNKTWGVIMLGSAALQLFAKTTKCLRFCRILLFSGKIHGAHCGRISGEYMAGIEEKLHFRKKVGLGDYHIVYIHIYVCVWYAFQVGIVEVGRVREEKRWREKTREEKESEGRRCRRAKR